MCTLCLDLNSKTRSSQVYDIQLVPKAQNCDELFFKKQVFWWEPLYDLVDGEMYCDWAKPNFQDSEGNWRQLTEKLARMPLIFTDRLTRENQDDGIRIGPYDSYVSSKIGRHLRFPLTGSCEPARLNSPPCFPLDDLVGLEPWIQVFDLLWRPRQRVGADGLRLGNPVHGDSTDRRLCV